jgi:hypothetical protein
MVGLLIAHILRPRSMGKESSPTAFCSKLVAELREIEHGMREKCLCYLGLFRDCPTRSLFRSSLFVYAACLYVGLSSLGARSSLFPICASKACQR